MQQKPEKLSARTRAASTKTILLVEDHPIFSAVIKRTIEEDMAHRVVHIKDGSRLLEALREYQPQLLMLDYELPGKNGIELYDLIRATPGWERLPTIIVSADPPRQALAERGLQVVNKPCRKGELVQAVERALAGD